MEVSVPYWMLYSELFWLMTKIRVSFYVGLQTYLCFV